MVVMQSGKVVRTSVSEVAAKGRDTMGVIFAKPGKNDEILEVARNYERNIDEADDTDENCAESPEKPADEVPLENNTTPAVADTADALGGKSEH